MLDVRDYNWSNSFDEEDIDMIQQAIELHDTPYRNIIARLCVICGQFELALDDYESEI